MFDELLERLTLFFTSERFKTDVTAGKRAFFDEAGIMDEENQAFEMRMNQFLEWYLFTRPLIDAGLTPAQYALQLEDFDMTPEERPSFEKLAATRHSLFEFLKIRGGDMYIRDLLLDKKIVIHDSPVQIGFNRDEFFDARLIPDGEEYRFTKAFCFHPSGATSYILSEVKKLRKAERSQAAEEALILKLMKMRYKYEQYRHLKIEHIYTNERKVRF